MGSEEEEEETNLNNNKQQQKGEGHNNTNSEEVCALMHHLSTYITLHFPLIDRQSFVMGIWELEKKLITKWVGNVITKNC